MLEKIKSLEAVSRKLEPSRSERADLIKHVTDYSQNFLEALEGKWSYKSASNNTNEPLRFEDPLPIKEILGSIDKNIDQTGINTTSGRHFGYIPGGGLYPSSLGDYIAAVTNRYVGIHFASPGGVKLENDLVKWMCSLIGYEPKTSGGTLTSGGSIANLTAIVNARDAANLKSTSFDKAVVYCTAQTHHCIPKALKIAGMGDSLIRTIPMVNFKMKGDILEQQINADRQQGLLPWLIVASAGTTDTGAIDPLEFLAEIAAKYGLWLNVDAAYGGAFLLIDRGQRLLKGIEQADSVIIDPHKGFFIPYGSGAVMVKDKKKLYASFTEQAYYMQDAISDIDMTSPADMSPELSRPFRGLRMWLPLKLFGLEPFKAALEEKILLCSYFHNQIKEWEGIEVGPDPELSVTIFRYIPPDGDPNKFNEKLVREIQNDGRIFLSSTTIEGNFYIRMAVASFRSHLAEVDLALSEIKKKIQYLREH